MKNKVIRGVLAAACVTPAVSAANVFGAGTTTKKTNTKQPTAEVQCGKSEETAVSVQAGSYYPWVNENGIWYFKDPDGTIVKGAWREYDKNRYYLNNDGKMAVGWKKLDGDWYYFQSWGCVYRVAF